MAFDILGFNCNRGTFNANASSECVTIHAYTSTTDTLAEIDAASYFPENFDFSEGQVLVNDILLVRGTDGYDFYQIDAVTPAGVISVENMSGFDQDLNTTDNVTFNSVSLASIAANPGGARTLWVDSADASLNFGSNILAVETSGTFPLTLEGPWAASQPIVVTYYKQGNVVTLSVPEVSVAAIHSGPITCGVTSVPVGLRPLTTSNACFSIIDNSADAAGKVNVNTSGAVQIDTYINSGSFTASGSAGFRSQCIVSYISA